MFEETEIDHDFFTKVLLSSNMETRIKFVNQIHTRDIQIYIEKLGINPEQLNFVTSVLEEDYSEKSDPEED
jgi:hypothetical protein